MSVFNRGGSSKSSTASTNTNTSVNANLQNTGENSTNLSLGQVGGSVTVTTIDAGTVDLALSAVQTAERTFQESLSFASETSELAFGSVDRALDRTLDFSGVVIDRSLDAVSDAYRGSLQEVSGAYRDSAARVGDAYRGSLDSVADAYGRSFDAASDVYKTGASAQQEAFSGALGFLGGLVDDVFGQVSQTREDTQEIARSSLDTVQDIARQQAQSGDQRIETISRTAIYGVVIAAAVIAAAIFLRR